MKPFSLLCMMALLLHFSTTIVAQSEIIYESNTLIIKKLSEKVYTHISFLETNDFGRVACNGMIALDDKEVIVLETPINDEVSAELIQWIEKELKAGVKAVIVHHFHQDCLGGLQAFHQRNISSFAREETIELAKEKGYVLPQQAIGDLREFKLGNQKLVSSYFGPAHTTDNIVTYYPSEKTLFGGCMIKSINATKGNLEDADVESWSASVQNIRDRYPDVQLVVPGHGEEGGHNLLDYTIELFQAK